MIARIEDRDWVATRLAAGDTVAAIGAAAGVSRQTASSWLRRHGLSANHGPKPRPSGSQMAADYERTRSIRDLAAEYGISAAVMRTWLFEAGIEAVGVPGRPSRPIDIESVRQRRAAGDTWAEIGADYQLSGEQLRRRLAGS